MNSGQQVFTGNAFPYRAVTDSVSLAGQEAPGFPASTSQVLGSQAQRGTQWRHTPLIPALGRQGQGHFFRVPGQPGLHRETLFQPTFLSSILVAVISTMKKQLGEGRGLFPSQLLIPRRQTQADSKAEAAVWLTGLFSMAACLPAFLYHQGPPAREGCPHNGLGPPTLATNQSVCVPHV